MTDDSNVSSIDTKQIIKSAKQGLVLEVAREKTVVFVMVVNKDNSKNRVDKIDAMLGVPIGGYVHDVINDCYNVLCEEVRLLGIIPYSLKLLIPNTGSFSTIVPIPEKLLRASFDEDQLKRVSDLESKYKKTEVNFHFPQFISPWYDT